MSNEVRFRMAYPVHLFMGELAPQFQNDGPVHQGIRQLTDTGHALAPQVLNLVGVKLSPWVRMT